MSDTWGTVPYSIFDDERLDGDDGPDRTFMVMILSLTDDRGRFEGSIDALCRRTGCSKKYVQERLESVKRRELIDLYQVEGRARPVGEVIRFHLLPGLPDTKRFEAKRRESAFPARDGTVEPSRRDKAKARGTHEAKPSTERGSDAEVAPTEPSASVTLSSTTGAVRAVPALFRAESSNWRSPSITIASLALRKADMGRTTPYPACVVSVIAAAPVAGL